MRIQQTCLDSQREEAKTAADVPPRNSAHITVQVEGKEKHGSGGGNKENFLILQSWGRAGGGEGQSRSEVLLGNGFGSERFPNQRFKAQWLTVLCLANLIT